MISSRPFQHGLLIACPCVASTGRPDAVRDEFTRSLSLIADFSWGERCDTSFPNFELGSRWSSRRVFPQKSIETSENARSMLGAFRRPVKLASRSPLRLSKGLARLYCRYCLFRNFDLTRSVVTLSKSARDASVSRRFRCRKRQLPQEQRDTSPTARVS